jgi:Ca-activated chloride channel family protein
MVAPRPPRGLPIAAALALAGMVWVGAQSQTPPPAQPPPAQPPPAQTPPAAQTPATPPASPPSSGQASSQPQSTPQSRFRGGVDLVSLTVTVTEGTRYVTDLNQEEFEVYEDGARQVVTFFSRVQQPIALAILLDTSASMSERLETAQEAAIGFVRRLRSEDVIEVIDFDSQVRILQEFTNDAAALERAIRNTDVNGSTSLYNAVYISLKELKKVKARTAEEIRRQAIVLLSDGDDTSSLVPYEEVLDLAKRSETAVYAIGLRPPSALRSEFKEAEFVLKQLSQETGGRAYFVNTVAELPRIYEQISEELASQYSLAYSSKNPLRNGAWRRVVVRLARTGLVARTRLGYYGPGAGR